MRLRFRKSIKVAPGVKINLNKNSTSVSFGKRGAHTQLIQRARKLLLLEYQEPEFPTVNQLEAVNLQKNPNIKVELRCFKTIILIMILPTTRNGIRKRVGSSHC